MRIVYQQFVKNFTQLQGVWDQELVPWRQLRDRLRNPRVSIVVRPKSGEDGNLKGAVV